MPVYRRRSSLSCEYESDAFVGRNGLVSALFLPNVLRFNHHDLVRYGRLCIQELQRVYLNNQVPERKSVLCLFYSK